MRHALIILLSSLLMVVLSSCSSKSKPGSGVDPSIPQSTEGATTIVEESGSNGKKDSKKSVSTTVTTVSNSKSATAAENPTYKALNQYIKSQEEDNILTEGSSLLMKNPNDVKAINAMAMSYYKRGQYPLAKSLLLRALKVDANSSEVHSNMGVVQLALGDKNEALKSFKKSIELNPNDYVGAANAGSLYVVEQDFNKASVVLEMAYSKGYRNPKVLSNYAIALVATGKYEKADQVYREASKENSNNKEVLFNHAILLIQFLKKNEEGLEIVRKLKFLGVPDESRKKLQELQTMAEKK